MISYRIYLLAKYAHVMQDNDDKTKKCTYSMNILRLKVMKQMNVHFQIKARMVCCYTC